MNSIHRQFGKLVSKGAGDNAKVSVLLSDYEDADKALTKIIEASKAWRDAWVSILTIQLALATGFEEMYNPIVGTSDVHRDNPALTPQVQLDRTAKLREEMAELKTDLMDEVIMMDSRVIGPATDAKEFIQPIRKTIKKRENKRLDWERYIDRVNNASKKTKRSERENAALAKAEQELAKASDAFKVADDHLRETLPPIISATFSLLPHLLNVQIMIQNSLLAQYYTTLHNYSEAMGFQSPPPPMVDVIAIWDGNFKPVQQQAESLTCIAKGKAVHQPMSPEDDRGRKPSSSLNVRNAFPTRRPSSQNTASDAVSPNPESRVRRIPSSNPIAVASPHLSPLPQPTLSYNPSHSSASRPSSSYSAHSSAGPTGDYFQRAAIAKKKPPPPPPKRIGSNNLALYAVALYSFDGQGQGDLSFKEHDRIRVIKKTDSTDDWWEGELRGVKGSFPANYCKIT